MVVVTHTVPIREGLVWNTDERWHPQNASFVNSRMQTVITCAQNTKITTWCFGPSHHSADFTWSGIRFVNNYRGCPGEKGWHGPMSIQP